MRENCISEIQVVSFFIIFLNFIHVFLHTTEWIQCCLFLYNATRGQSEVYTEMLAKHTNRCNVLNTLIWVTIFQWNSHTLSEQLNIYTQKEWENSYTNTLVLNRTCILCDDNGHKARLHAMCPHRSDSTNEHKGERERERGRKSQQNGMNKTMVATTTTTKNTHIIRIIKCDNMFVHAALTFLPIACTLHTAHYTVAFMYVCVCALNGILSIFGIDAHLEFSFQLSCDYCFATGACCFLKYKMHLYKNLEIKTEINAQRQNWFSSEWKNGCGDRGQMEWWFALQQQ